jgi:hypothetical protein
MADIHDHAYLGRWADEEELFDYFLDAYMKRMRTKGEVVIATLEALDSLGLIPAAARAIHARSKEEQ